MAEPVANPPTPVEHSHDGQLLQQNDEFAASLLPPRASLLGLPVELRLQIYEKLCVKLKPRTRILCCRATDHFYLPGVPSELTKVPECFENREINPNSETVQTIKALLSLFKTNRQMHGEVLPVLYDRLEFAVCLDDHETDTRVSRSGAPKLQGAGFEIGSQMEDTSSIEAQVSKLQHFKSIRITLELTTVGKISTHDDDGFYSYGLGTIRLDDLLEYHLHYIDSLCYFIHLLNRLPKLEEVNVLFFVCTEHTDFSLCLDVYLSPFQRLSDRAKLCINLVFKEDYEGILPEYPYAEDGSEEEYMKHLMPHHGQRCDFFRPTPSPDLILRREWIQARNFMTKRYLNPAAQRALQKYNDWGRFDRDESTGPEKLVVANALKLWDAYCAADHDTFNSALGGDGGFVAENEVKLACGGTADHGIKRGRTEGRQS